MFLIPDDATLRRLIPNVMATLPGDRTLFERIEPQLISAELWLETNLIDRPMLGSLVDMAQSADDPLYHLPRRLVALTAWRAAIPSLDLIVTANGLSAVETKTTKPASKAKIDRLLESLDADIDRTQLTLLGELLNSRDWRDSALGRRYCSTLFCFPEEILKLTEILPDLFKGGSGGRTVIDRWLGGLDAVLTAELTAARKWISEGVMARLRKLKSENTWLTQYRDCSGLADGRYTGDEPESAVIRLVMTAVAKYLSVSRSSGGAWPVGPGEMPAGEYPWMESAREIVAGNPMRFPEFQGSPQHLLMKQRGHENRRDSRGYFF